MVKSARWRTAFDFATEGAETIEFVTLLASFASNIAAARPEFDAIGRLRESQALKAVQYLKLANAVAYRTAAGVITGGVHGMYQALVGWCMIGGALADGLENATSNRCVQTINSADWLVQKVGRGIADAAANNSPGLTLIEIGIRKRESSELSSSFPAP
jgi:hypothetical protein